MAALPASPVHRTSESSPRLFAVPSGPGQAREAHGDVVARVGVIGYGYWGPNLVRNMAETRGAEVAACCDLDPNRLATVLRRYPSVHTTTDYHDLLNDDEIDAIVIATPVSSHYRLAREALEAGKHVLVEKPLAANTEQCEALSALAAERGLVLMVDHTFLFTGAVKKIKELIDAGELGDIYYYDSVRISLGLFQHDVNVLWDLAPHDIAIMSYLLGTVPERVSAVGASHVNHVENMAYLTMQYPNQLLAHLHVNWLAPAKVRRTIIGGSKKMIVYDDMDMSEKVKVYDSGAAISNDPEHIERMMVEYRTGDMCAPKLEKVEALAVECAHFVSCIAEGTTPISDAALGTHTVRVLEAAERSLRAGGSMEDLH